MARESLKRHTSKCQTCGAKIPETFRSDKKYCDRRCEYLWKSAQIGRKRHVDIESRFWSKVTKGNPDECWPWTDGSIHRGYGVLSVGGRNGRMVNAHRVSYELANGPIPAGLLIRHTCDNPPCVNPSHLILGTHDDNMRDMAIRERSAKTKLTADEVREIREELSAGESRKSLAARFGVTPGCIGYIAVGRTWRHVV